MTVVTTLSRKSSVETSVTRCLSSQDNGLLLEIDLIQERADLTNHTGSPLNLTGWKLTSEVGTQAFSYPDGLTLGPGEVVTVWSGPTGDQHGSSTTPTHTHLLWTRRYIWNNAGDVAVLVNAAGESVQTVTATPVSADQAVTTMKQNECAIM